MKAVVRLKYGSPDDLSIKELNTPVPKDNEVLVRVHATTVNRTDLGLLKGTPFLMRLFSGIRKPRLTITGTDFAGQVEATGKDVTSFKRGDNVIGFGGIGLQSHAEYLTIPETKAIVSMPVNLTYHEAAACIEGAFYALSAFIHNVHLKPGQKVLVIGGTGAISSALIQLLKPYGVSITAVCSGEHSALVKSLGADKIIDYKKDDFTKDNEEYDFVFDAVGKSTFGKCKPLLKKHGIYSSSDGLVNILWAIITPLFGGKKVIFIPPRNVKAGLGAIKDLIEKGSFRPVIDRKYPLDKIVEAFKYVATGEKIGNVIITIDA